MHHGILVKVKGDDVLLAEGQADKIMDKTICCHECGSSVVHTNWDYFKCIGEYNEAFIKENREDLIAEGIDTVEKAVEHYLEMRKGSVEALEGRVRDELAKYSQKLKEDGEFDDISYLPYAIKNLQELNNIMKYGDADDGYYTLHSTDNHYADLTEMSIGDKIFYLWYDRHY